MEEENKKPEGEQPEANEPVKTEPAAEEQNNAAKSSEGKPSADDSTQKKVVCALAYLFGILFFLPLVMYPNDEFAKFHANQALVVLLVVVIGEMILGILNIVPVVGFIFGILCGVFGLLMLIACIFAILGVVREEKFELPVIGKIKILK